MFEFCWRQNFNDAHFARNDVKWYLFDWFSTTVFWKDLMFYCRLHGGLEPLVELIKDSENSSNKKLLAAVTGALWKVASDAENVERLIDLGIVPTLIRLLLDNSDALDDLQFNPLKIAVLTNVVGALAETAKTSQSNRELIKSENGLAPLIKLIGTNHPDLLVNVRLVISFSVWFPLLIRKSLVLHWESVPRTKIPS